MELKAHYPTVYIDAWQQDFSDDPLLTVISSIIEQLKEEAGSPQLSPYLSTKLASLLKATAPIVTKALFKKVSGINVDEVQDIITADDAGKLVSHFFKTPVKDRSSTVAQTRNTAVGWGNYWQEKETGTCVYPD